MKKLFLLLLVFVLTAPDVSRATGIAYGWLMPGGSISDIPPPHARADVAAGSAAHQELILPPDMIDAALGLYYGVCNRGAACVANSMIIGVTLMLRSMQPPGEPRLPTARIPIPMAQMGIAVYEDLCNRDRDCLERVGNAAINDPELSLIAEQLMDVIMGRTRTMPDTNMILQELRRRFL